MKQRDIAHELLHDFWRSHLPFHTIEKAIVGWICQWLSTPESHCCVPVRDLRYPLFQPNRSPEYCRVGNESAENRRFFRTP